MIEIVRKTNGRGGEPRPPIGPLGPPGTGAGGIDPPGEGTDTSDIARREDVTEAIGKLPPELRQVCELHIFAGLTLRDVAELLNLTYDQEKALMRLIDLIRRAEKPEDKGFMGSYWG